jgi:hypothetical protein
MSASMEGPPALLVIFKKMFGSFADSHIIKQNDFCNLQSYFLQKVSWPTEMLDLTSTYPVIKEMCLQLLLNTVYALLIMGLSVAPTLSPDEAPHILLSSFISLKNTEVWIHKMRSCRNDLTPS